MPRLALVLMLAWGVLPAFAAKRVTVDQLEKLLAPLHGEPDIKAAGKISDLELTERPSAPAVARMKAELPGVLSQQALAALTDVAGFLKPPVAEIPATPPPDAPARNSLFALATTYMRETIPRLPNFLATRVTTRFEDTPAEYDTMQHPAILYKPLHVVDTSSVIVANRNGRETAETEKANGDKPPASIPKQNSSGEFGPILLTLMADLPKGVVLWDRWELGATGLMAVFSYSVPQPSAHFAVNFPEPSKKHQNFPAYHGEIAIDPANGTVLRLTMQADQKPEDPVRRANLLVEYAAAEIGGKTYFCPTRSVALSIIRDRQSVLGRRGLEISETETLRTELNDTQFKDYHLFRSDVRVLTGDGGQPEGNPPAAAPAPAPPPAPTQAPHP